MFKKIFMLVVVTTVLLSSLTIGAAFAAEEVTWNPKDCSSTITLTNSNLTVDTSKTVGRLVRATQGKTQGKWYFEFTLEDHATQAGFIGVCTANVPLESDVRTNSEMRGYKPYLGMKSSTSSGNGVSYSEGSTEGDVIGVLLDLDNGTLEYTKNGESLGVAFDDLLSLGEVYPCAINSSTIGKQLVGTANFGASTFAYSVPDGYSAYNDDGVIEVPQNLNVSAGDSLIELSWDEVEDAESYTVLRSEQQGGSYTIIAEDVKETAYTDNSVTNGNIYYYVVQAIGDSTESEYSSEVSATPTPDIPTSPTNLVAAVEDGNVNLSWDTAAGASTYNIKRSQTSGGTYETIATTVSEAVYEDNSVEAGITYYYVVSAENISGESENSNEVSAMVQKDLELDIEADEYTLSGNTEFEVQVVINEASSIYAEDITINYNTDLFEYISEETANPDNMEIYYKNTDTSGALRYIVASKGSEYGLDDTAQILTLRFTTKNVSGEGDIKVASGLVADGDGIEYEPICSGKTFTVNVIDTDVNRDGEYTLGDLAIAGKLFDTEESSWEPFYPDVDSDSSVTEFDLQYIVESILSQN